MLTTDQKGVIAELAIARHAADLGIDVWHPYAVERYDLSFDLRNQLVRVQCKWASRHGDVLVVRLFSHRRNRDGLVRRRYAAGEIDAFSASRNNQQHGINWAKDFEFAATLRPTPGAIAQLGER